MRDVRHTARISTVQDACADLLSHTNSVKSSCSPCVLVAQWIEHSNGVQDVMSPFSVVESDFFFIPSSC